VSRVRAAVLAAGLALLAVSGCGSRSGVLAAGNSASPGPVAADPANATYRVEGARVTLRGGTAERPAAPGAAESVQTRLFGTPVWGDLDGDGEDDAAVLLLHLSGGSGSFYYVAAALRRGEGFDGTNAVLLGDRVAPQSLQVRNGMLMAHYAERRPVEPMTAVPREAKTKVLTWRAGELVESPPVDKGMLLTEGWVTIGHEVRAFEPCGRNGEVWLDPASEGFAAIRDAYAAALPPDARPYTPVFMTLTGRLAAAPRDGFGMDYAASFGDARLVQVWSRGNCRADEVSLTTPLAGSVVRSPLKVRGRAPGTWFFEGDFPVHLKDRKGRIVGSGVARASGPWMTRERVPFEAELHFAASPQPVRGTLVLVKDNPTDDRSLDDAVEFPLFYR